MNFQQFIQALNELKSQYPLPQNHSKNCENAEEGDYLYNVKNGWFSFDTSDSENIIYIFDSFKANNCIDGDYVIESEFCYECIDVLKAYNSAYLNFCARIYDSYFCYNCNDSNNLFGCAYLNHKQYCIFNRQYSQGEYFQKIKELLQRSPTENLNDLKKLLLNFPVTETFVKNSENSEYCNHVYDSKNLYLSFDSSHCENCAYIYDSHHNKNCYDLYQTFNSEWCYQCINCSHLNKCFFMKDCEKIYESGFCYDCFNSHHLFGCIALRNQEYCLLNKKLTPEDYEREVEEIMTSFRSLFSS